MTTLSIMIFIRTTLSKTTHNVMALIVTLYKNALYRTTLRVVTLNIMTLSIMTLSIMTLSIITFAIRHSAK
jgi:hypothetical protein